MKVNIYYGGRGVLDDPTLYVINKMQKVLEELRVTVDRYNIYEQKNSITTLPQTIKEADGIILATTVEWLGIGGYMMQFLDACWLYGDKDKISEIYMCPIVMSTTYGEQEGKLNLATAWEILGGRPCSGLCGYIADTGILENNEEYQRIIEKKAENLYRTINQKMPCLPASNQAVKQYRSDAAGIRTAFPVCVRRQLCTEAEGGYPGTDQPVPGFDGEQREREQYGISAGTENPFPAAGRRCGEI